MRRPIRNLEKANALKRKKKAVGRRKKKRKRKPDNKLQK